MEIEALLKTLSLGWEPAGGGLVEENRDAA
jgi:hypothetical protein